MEDTCKLKNSDKRNIVPFDREHEIRHYIKLGFTKEEIVDWFYQTEEEHLREIDVKRLLR